MKKLAALILSLILTICSLSACGSPSAYEDGYSSGFDAGFAAGYRAGLSAATATPEQTTPAQQEAPQSHPQETMSQGLPEPENGHIIEDISREKVAPFTVNTSGDGGYFIVLDPLRFPFTGGGFDRTEADMQAKYSYLKFYVDAGSSVELLVPLGTYEVYYATGEIWYGENHLFGTETAYYKCDGEFTFSESEDGYNGWTLTLETAWNGNLDTDKIDANKFPH